MLRKIGLSSLRGACQRLLAPRIPVDRVVGVLQQVGAGLVDEAVGVLGGVGHRCMVARPHDGLVSSPAPRPCPPRLYRPPATRLCPPRVPANRRLSCPDSMPVWHGTAKCFASLPLWPRRARRQLEGAESGQPRAVVGRISHGRHRTRPAHGRGRSPRTAEGAPRARQRTRPAHGRGRSPRTAEGAPRARQRALQHDDAVGRRDRAGSQRLHHGSRVKRERTGECTAVLPKHTSVVMCRGHHQDDTIDRHYRATSTPPSAGRPGCRRAASRRRRRGCPLP